ncbi:elongation factor Ts [Pseudohyphozyma bogoriensis]|nr:elongation factor Ts [Pseudohyphozyma bogoriensis]
MSSFSRLALRALPSSSRPSPAPSRLFSTSPLRQLHASPLPLADAPKASVQLISKIRARRPGTPLSLARTALVNTNNDLEGALAWIAEQAAESGAAKAKKLEGRTATEGLVGVAMLADGTGGVGVRAAMVELSCETDFVARTDEFRELLENVTRSLAFFAEPSKDDIFTRHDPAAIAEVPLVPGPASDPPVSPMSTTTLPTISTSIAALVSRLGENISLRRAVSLAIEPVLPTSPLHLASTYLHGASSSKSDTSFQSGSLAGLLVLRLPEGGEVARKDVNKLARALARQVVAVPTTAVKGLEAGKVSEESKNLYEQPIMTLASSPDLEFEGGASVQKVLELWSAKRALAGEGLQVVELARWGVGETEAAEDSAEA